MRVLITASSLDDIGGVQAYVRNLAAWLLAHDHSPVVYSPVLGAAAAEIRRFTIPVTDDLSTIADAPDVIHGNSAAETMTAMLHFPATPGLFTCHGWRGAEARPPHFPRLVHYVAVDETCADRLRNEEGVPSSKMTVLLNGVDTSVFAARSTPLPGTPRRALVFGNAAHEASHLSVIREVCSRRAISVDVASTSAGTFVAAPETILGNYDLVFAKARCALEAMASGAAVVLCDVAGVGGMVRSADVERLRRLNFGARTLVRPVDSGEIERAIDSYDPADAAAVSEFIRRTAAADILHARIVELCEGVVRTHAAMPVDRVAEGKAAAAFLRRITVADGANTARLNLVVQATHRMLQAPVVGPLLTRGARWLVRRGRKSAW